MKTQSVYAGLEKSVVVLDFLGPTSIADLWTTLVPKYASLQWRSGILFRVEWDPKYADAIRELNRERKIENRRRGYINWGEIDRARRKLKNKREGSIRFGWSLDKKGWGIKGERGDYCLVGGVMRGGKTFFDLHVFYRNLEMIGGFAYDLLLYRMLENNIGKPLRYLTVYATRAHTIGVKKNSNESLYPQLRRIFH